MNRAEARMSALAAAETLAKTQQLFYYTQLRSTQREWEADQINLARETLATCPVELRDWEYDYLYTLVAPRDPSQEPKSASVIETGYEVRSLAVRPDGSICFSGAPGSAVDCWDATSGALMSTLVRQQDLEGEQPAVALSPDAKTLLSSGAGAALHVWDTATGELKHTLQVPGGEARSLAFADNGESFVSCGAKGAITLWRTSKLRPLWSHAFVAGPCTASLSPDGRRGASGGSSGVVQVWSAETGEIQLELTGQDGAVRGLAFSRDGYWLAGAKGDGVVAVWDAETGHLEHRLSGHQGAANVLVFSEDGRRLLSGGDDGTIVIWNMLTGERVMSLPGHSAAVEALGFSDQDQKLFSGGADNSLRIWDASRTAPKP